MRVARAAVVVGVFLACPGFGACSNPVSPDPGAGSTSPGNVGTTMRFGSAGTFRLTVDGSPVTTITRMSVANYIDLENELPTFSIALDEPQQDPNRQHFELTISPTAGPHAIPYEPDESDPVAGMTYDQGKRRWQAINRTGNAAITVSSVTPRSIAGSFDGTVEATVGGATGSRQVSGEFVANFDCAANACSSGRQGIAAASINLTGGHE